MKLVETAWNDYQRRVIPPKASQVQVDECKRAFYAGCGELLSILIRVLSPGTEPTESDIAMLDGVAKELEEFVNEQIKKCDLQ